MKTRPECGKQQEDKSMPEDAPRQICEVVVVIKVAAISWRLKTVPVSATELAKLARAALAGAVGNREL